MWHVSDCKDSPCVRCRIAESGLLTDRLSPFDEIKLLQLGTELIHQVYKSAVYKSLFCCRKEFQSRTVRQNCLQYA